MSLRVRLVATVLGIVVLGLGGAVGATFGALQDWANDRDDDVLTATGRQLREALAEPGQRLDTSTATDDVTGVWRSAAERGEAPSYFAVHLRDGHLVQVVSHGSVPGLANPLPVRFHPRPRGDAAADGESFRRTDTGWLVRSSWLSDGRILVVAMRTGVSDELLHRTRNVALGCTVAALLAVALLTWYAVRRALRPLERIAATADEIGAGDLSRRVEPSDPGTEVGRLSAALNAMLGQLESAFAERTASQQRLRRFVSDASHELRTPVATVRGYAELFRRGAANRPGDLAKAMHRIESEAGRMGALVEELLLLARLDEGRPVRREPVDLVALATDAIADARTVDPDRPLRLDAPESVVVPGDPERLLQVYGNLLSNVRRHTPPDSPATIRVTRDGDHAVIEVSDTGPGLDAEHAARVFERFYRADSARTRPSGGSGLGLAIVAAIATAHDGEVSVESTPEKGATFRVRLPCRVSR